MVSIKEKITLNQTSIIQLKCGTHLLLEAVD